MSPSLRAVLVLTLTLTLSACASRMVAPYIRPAPEHAMPREELVALLWGDRFDQQGRSLLELPQGSPALSAVAKILGDHLFK